MSRARILVRIFRGSSKFAAKSLSKIKKYLYYLPIQILKRGWKRVNKIYNWISQVLFFTKKAFINRIRLVRDRLLLIDNKEVIKNPKLLAKELDRTGVLYRTVIVAFFSAYASLMKSLTSVAEFSTEYIFDLGIAAFGGSTPTNQIGANVLIIIIWLPLIIIPVVQIVAGILIAISIISAFQGLLRLFFE